MTELSYEEREVEFNNAIDSFAQLFGVEITEYSLDMSAHRPPYIEFMGKEFSGEDGDEFHGEVGMGTWRNMTGGCNGKINHREPVEEWHEWISENGKYGVAMHDAFQRELIIAPLDINQAFAFSLFRALDIVTT